MVNKKTIEDIRTRLGYPSITVELSDKQIEAAIDIATEDFKIFMATVPEEKYKNIPSIKNIWKKRYALAVCKEILGRVRGKFDPPVTIPGKEKVSIDAKELLAESFEEKNFLFSLFSKQ